MWGLDRARRWARQTQMHVPAMGLVQSGTARWWQTRSKMPPFHPPTLHPSSQQTWIKGLLCSEAPGLDVGVEVIRKNTYSLTSENSKSRRGARESLTGYEAPPPPHHCQETVREMKTHAQRPQPALGRQQDKDSRLLPPSGSAFFHGPSRAPQACLQRSCPYQGAHY